MKWKLFFMFHDDGIPSRYGDYSFDSKEKAICYKHKFLLWRKEDNILFKTPPLLEIPFSKIKCIFVLPANQEVKRENERI